MKAMRQGEVDMMKVIHADLPAHLQSVVRIEGDNVFINETGLGGLPASTTAAPQFTQFPPSTVPPTMYIKWSSPTAAVSGLPDFSKPPPSMRPVNGTSNGSLPKTASSNALPDVAVAPNRSSAPPAMASATVPPPSAAPPINFNVPPPNVASGSGTARAPYMQPSSFLGPPPGTSNPALAQDFTKTITNMITSALKAPANAGVNAFGARPGMRTYVGPGMSLMGNGPPPPNMHDNGGSGDGDWTSNRRGYQYRGKSGFGKRQGNDRRGSF
ncbi:hypothetical protein TELCIR_07146 [Teladorsagia circumcincta]|uniref:Uncharacterized protein n=1 Tax=Teladorsagia circumcincta TaxID=45464 RepID=A0A2G9UL66_TELCI|nr:hypothetical protein TELCIR_07146 [Teladorsagia circumcincta]